MIYKESTEFSIMIINIIQLINIHTKLYLFMFNRLSRIILTYYFSIDDFTTIWMTRWNVKLPKSTNVTACLPAVNSNLKFKVEDWQRRKSKENALKVNVIYKSTKQAGYVIPNVTQFPLHVRTNSIPWWLDFHVSNLLCFFDFLSSAGEDVTLNTQSLIIGFIVGNTLRQANNPTRNIYVKFPVSISLLQTLVSVWLQRWASNKSCLLQNLLRRRKWVKHCRCCFYCFTG